jgi:hypothetical protein
MKHERYMDATDKAEWSKAKRLIAEGRKMKTRIWARLSMRARRDGGNGE